MPPDNHSFNTLIQKNLNFDKSLEEDEEVLTLDEIRQRNAEKISALMSSLRDPELEKEFAAFNSKINTTKRPPKKTGKRDTLFKFSGIIPQETRKSSRLQNKNPEYNGSFVDDICETSRKAYFNTVPDTNFDDDLEDLEAVVHKPKRKSHLKRSTNSEQRLIVRVEDVTEEMLNNIAFRVKGKVYSTVGTTCHQCRQKTLDQKTCCRGPDCYGIQGMFCGICLKNRYGENAAEALKDPNWICPVCRGGCNCSICRNKQGKRPTGILAPIAQQHGYKSVDEFLKVLKGRGDRPEMDNLWELQQDPEALLGFSDGGRKTHFIGNSSILRCNLCAYWQRKDLQKELDEDPEALLGFSHDQRKAHLNYGYFIFTCDFCA